MDELISARQDEAAHQLLQDRIIALDVAGESLAEVRLVTKSRVGGVRSRVGAALAAMILQCSGFDQKEVSRELLLSVVSFGTTPSEIRLCIPAPGEELLEVGRRRNNVKVCNQPTAAEATALKQLELYTVGFLKGPTVL